MLRWPAGWILLALAVACSTVDGRDARPSSVTETAVIETAVTETAVTETAVIENAIGTVVKVGHLGFGLVPDEDRGTRYAPTEPLPESFREDGLRVRFSGNPGDPSDVKGRRWGTPFEVTSIERLGSEPP